MTYPEHEKLHAVKEKSQAIGEFIEWLLGQKAFTLAKWREDELMPEHINIEELLAEYFSINLGKLEQEKQAMLEDFRKRSQRT